MRESAVSYPFADLSLARRLERAEAEGCARFVEARSRLVLDSGAAWIDVAGTYAMFDGPSSPLTQTFGFGLFAPPAAENRIDLERFSAIAARRCQRLAAQRRAPRIPHRLHANEVAHALEERKERKENDART